jgi:hypothetical protein
VAIIESRCCRRSLATATAYAFWASTSDASARTEETKVRRIERNNEYSSAGLHDGLPESLPHGLLVSADKSFDACPAAGATAGSNRSANHSMRDCMLVLLRKSSDAYPAAFPTACPYRPANRSMRARRLAQARRLARIARRMVRHLPSGLSQRLSRIAW